MRNALLFLSLLIIILLKFASPLSAGISNENETVKRLFALHHGIVEAHNKGNDARSDSLFNRATALLRSNPEYHHSLIEAYFQYFQLNKGAADEDFMRKTVLEMAGEAQACKDDYCEAIAESLLARVYIARGAPDTAQRASALALDAALRAKDNRAMSEAQLARAIVLDRCNQKLEAFRILQDLHFNAATRENLPMLEMCNNLLSEFYLVIGEYDSALSKKRAELNIAAISSGNDEERLFPIRLELARALLRTSRHQDEGIDQMYQLLTDANRQHKVGLKKDVLTFFRDYYLEKEDYTALAMLYRQYTNPADDLDLHSNDPTLWYRVHSFYAIADNKPDSAIWLLDHAAQLVRSEANSYGKSIYFLRFGFFLRSIGHTDSAIAMLREAYKYGEEADKYLPFMIRITGALQTLYASKNNFEQAYRMLSLNTSFSEQKAKSVSNDELLRYDIFYAAEQQKFLEKRDAELTYTRHMTQYTFIAFSITLFFVVLAFLGSFSVPKFVIRSTGILAFVFLFEFIVMISENLTYPITHHEPWRMMITRVIIVLLLAPLHHWMEEKVLHYLYEHKLISSFSFKLRPLLQRLRKAPAAIAEKESEDTWRE